MACVSDGSRIEEMEFLWFPENPIQNNTALRLPELTLVSADTRNCTEVFVMGKCYIYRDKTKINIAHRAPQFIPDLHQYCKYL